MCSHRNDRYHVEMLHSVYEKDLVAATTSTTDVKPRMIFVSRDLKD